MSCLPIANALIVPPFLIIASDISNPCGNNQHGIKIVCSTFNLMSPPCLHFMHFKPSRRWAAGYVWTIQPREEWEWTQYQWETDEIEWTISQVQYPVCVPNLLSTHILTIWCIGSIHCPLYERGWVSLVCARTSQCLNSMFKPYWISKLMILQVVGCPSGGAMPAKLWYTHFSVGNTGGFATGCQPMKQWQHLENQWP